MALSNASSSSLLYVRAFIVHDRATLFCSVLLRSAWTLNSPAMTFNSSLFLHFSLEFIRSISFQPLKEGKERKCDGSAQKAKYLQEQTVNAVSHVLSLTGFGYYLVSYAFSLDFPSLNRSVVLFVFSVVYFLCISTFFFTQKKRIRNAHGWCHTK